MDFAAPGARAHAPVTSEESERVRCGRDCLWGQHDSETGINGSASVSHDRLTMWAPHTGVTDENAGAG